MSSDGPAVVEQEQGLVRALGVRGLAASIFNATVGGGIFVLPAVVAGLLGPAAPLAYLACAVAMGLIVLCFAEAGSRVTLTGGPYAYVEQVFGPYAGFMTGVLLWVLGVFAMASVATAFAGALASLLPALGHPVAREAVLLVARGTLAAVNIRGVQVGARLIEGVSVAKLAPLLLLVGVGLFALEPAALRIPALPSGGELARTCIVLLFAFTGVECALVPSGEVKEPARTVPRALALAMVGITVLYLLVQLVAQGVLGAGLADAKQAPLADVAARLAGPGGRLLLLAGASISMFGYLSGMTLAVPRALYAFARDGLLPPAVGAIHPRFRTPHVAIALQATLVFLLAVSGTFERLAIIANVAVLLLYLACCVAALELRRRGVQSSGLPLRVPGGPLVVVAACAIILWMLSSATWQEFAVVGGILTVASVQFVATRGRRRAVTPAQPGA
jgi:basic amino acid/polyamine antiporter, APA family